TERIGGGIKEAAPILLITGAGGALGSVIQETAITDLVEGLGQNAFFTGVFFIFIRFFIAMAVKSAHRASTAEIVISSTLVAPLLGEAGIAGAVPLSLVIMAIGSGSMVVSHVNDSYFWVVKEFSGMSVTQAYKAQTMATLLQGIVAMLVTFILWIIFV